MIEVRFFRPAYVCSPSFSIYPCTCRRLPAFTRLTFSSFPSPPFLSPLFIFRFFEYVYASLPTGNVLSLETFNDPHLAAVLLKKYLRDLPTAIFPEEMYGTIRRCPMPR
jgi:hypothetical protein